MIIKRWKIAALAGGFALVMGPALVSAQTKVKEQDEIELGATRPTQVEMSAGHEHRGHARAEVAESDNGGLRIGMQARIDALNSLEFAVPDIEGAGADASAGRHLMVPLIAPGVRFLDDRLYLGLGLGLAGANHDNGTTSTSRSGFSLTPMAHYDLLLDGPVAFSVGGWLNLAHLSKTETCVQNGTCTTANNDITGWGLSLAGGLHAWLMRGLSLGGEFGWGFLSLSEDPGADTFVHGLFGTIVLEATIGT